jgi:hypothetical protein
MRLEAVGVAKVGEVRAYNARYRGAKMANPPVWKRKE